MKNIEFFYISIYLDYLLITGRFLNNFESLDFIFKKYFLILKHFFIPFKLSNSYITLFNNKFFYDSKYGIASLQGSFTRHYLLLNSLKSKNIDTVIDIGANVGTFSMLCSRLFKPKKIFSFEPIPLTFECLKKNCSVLKNIKVFNYALSEKKGIQRMKFKENYSSISSFSYEKNEEHNLVKVETNNLNNFVKDNNLKKIDLLKIDVESFEHLVLIGASEVLKMVIYLLIEVTINNNKNYTISKIFSLLNGDGYDFQLIYFRNFSDKSYGKVDLMDCLLENQSYKKYPKI